MAVADAAAHTLGSAVELVVEKSGLTRACSLVFGLPLLGLLIGAGIVGEMNGAAAAEIGAGVGGLCGVIGVLAGRRALQTWIKPKLLAASQNPTAVIEDKS
jgi:positive regulator of sigma E activity